MPVIFNRVKALSPGNRNPDQALRALARMQRAGIFREMKLRRNHETPCARAPAGWRAGRTRRRQVMSFHARLR
ncbi:30S ribosomal protein S21 [Inquilinus sp.]|uniref:30S ribosomal protein S21 n=1 Tax=Inquilinus sp. TaxID=1932117 RepID=UPI003784BF42